MVIFSIFVGSLTGPLTRRFLSLALLIRSVETVNYMSAGGLEMKGNNRVQTLFEVPDISRG